MLLHLSCNARTVLLYVRNLSFRYLSVAARKHCNCKQLRSFSVLMLSYCLLIGGQMYCGHSAINDKMHAAE